MHCIFLFITFWFLFIVYSGSFRHSVVETFPTSFDCSKYRAICCSQCWTLLVYSDSPPHCSAVYGRLYLFCLVFVTNLEQLCVVAYALIATSSILHIYMIKYCSNTCLLINCRRIPLANPQVVYLLPSLPLFPVDYRLLLPLLNLQLSPLLSQLWNPLFR